MQLEFLIKELKTSFPDVYRTLTIAKTVQEASDIVLLDFEKPKNTSAAVQKKRANFGIKFFNRYASSQNAKEKIQEAASAFTKPSKKNKYNLVLKTAYGITNTSQKMKRKIEFIVIHYTAGVKSNAGSALEVASWCKNGGL
jgi:hypothetical protein